MHLQADVRYQYGGSSPVYPVAFLVLNQLLDSIRFGLEWAGGANVNRFSLILRKAQCLAAGGANKPGFKQKALDKVDTDIPRKG